MAYTLTIVPENMPGFIPILTLNRALDHDYGALIFAVMYFKAIVTLANLNRVIWVTPARESLSTPDGRNSVAGIV